VNRTGRFAASCLLIAVVTGAVVYAVTAPRGAEIVRWCMTGWAVIAVVGVVSGVLMVRLHGKPGAGFLAAMGTGMVGRLVLSAAAALWAAQHGIEYVWALLAGIVSAYLPLQAFEVIWFFRESGRHDGIR
jgi:uncharacterized membrane protein YeaQ/YmgE (transglycosylase-associated protein family)